LVTPLLDGPGPNTMKNITIPIDVIRNAHADFSSVLLDGESAKQLEEMHERNSTIYIKRCILYLLDREKGYVLLLTLYIYFKNNTF